VVVEYLVADDENIDAALSGAQSAANG